MSMIKSLFINTSKIGLLFAGLYVIGCAYFLMDEKLFDEGVIIVLGIPWVAMLGLPLEVMEHLFGSIEPIYNFFFEALLVLPLIINTALLYLLGYFLDGSTKERRVAEAQITEEHIVQ